MQLLNGEAFPFAKQLYWAVSCAYYFMGVFIAYFWLVCSLGMGGLYWNSSR
jgi:hypothetical protein